MTQRPHKTKGALPGNIPSSLQILFGIPPKSNRLVLGPRRRVSSAGSSGIAMANEPTRSGLSSRTTCLVDTRLLVSLFQPVSPRPAPRAHGPLTLTQEHAMI